MIKFNTYPNFSLEQLEKMKITKGELMQKMFGNQQGIDTALPINWVKFFCDKYPDISRQLLISTTFFVYDDSYRGYPVSGCKEVQNVISEYLNDF